MSTTDTVEGAYVALAIVPTVPLCELQRGVCAKYSCTPRPELHVTIGYLGSCSYSSASIIAEALRQWAPQTFHVLETSGVGGAMLDSTGQPQLFKPSTDLVLMSPRVIWLTLLPTDELMTLRKELIVAAHSAGADPTYMQSTFFPHMTLGSAGPGEPTDWSRFDIHNLPKIASLKAVHCTIDVEAIHITNAEAAPDSVVKIRTYSVVR